jgi:hypothetical protein
MVHNYHCPFATPPAKCKEKVLSIFISLRTYKKSFCSKICPCFFKKKNVQ